MSGAWERVVHPRVQHLELWDAPVAGTTLFAARKEARFAALVAEVARANASGVSTVFLAGGDPRLCEVESALALRGFEVVSARDPVFIGEVGARAIGPRSCRTLCVDCGQTSIKLSVAEHRSRYERSPEWQGAPGFSRGIAALVHAAPRHDAVVLGLPCEIVGREGRASSYFESLPLAALAAELACPVSLLSDAELAAHGAMVERPSPAPMLVLTLGFGVGAAMVHREVGGLA